MKRQSGFVALCGLLCGAAWASTLAFHSTWSNPSARPIELSGSKMAVVFMSSDPAQRRDAEEVLVGELARHGIQAVPSQPILPSPGGGDMSAMLSRFAESGINTVLVMRVLGEGASLSAHLPPYFVVPPPWEYRWLSLYWGYGWGIVQQPAYLQTDTAISIEALVYSLPRDRLVWGGRSWPAHRYQIPELTAQLGDLVTAQMSRDGALKP